MAWIQVRAAISIFVFASLPFAVMAQATTKIGDADTISIKKDVSDFTDAYNNHDALTCATHFLEDADFINVQGSATHGRKAIEDHWPALFAGRLKDAHRKVSVKSIRYLTSEIAFMSADWELTNSQLVDGGPIIPLRRGLYDWVMVKQNGRWLIAVFHESNLPLAQSK